MTEPTTGPTRDHPGDAESLPQRARPGKLAWFGMTAGLGFVLALWGSLGFALARALVELVGPVDGWASRFLELGLLLMLLIPAQIALMALFLGKRSERFLDRLAPDQKATGSKARALPMSDEAFWVIGVCGFIIGVTAVMAVWIPFDGIVPEEPHIQNSIFLIAFMPGLYVISLFFVITRGTNGPNADHEPESKE